MTLATSAGIVACLCYGVSTFLIIRSLKTNVPVNARGLVSISLLGLVSHGFYLHNTLFPEGGIQLGVATMTCLFGLVLAATGTVVALYRHIDSLLAPTYPAAAIGVLISLLYQDNITPIDHLSRGVIGHILLSISAYCIISLALCQAILLWIQNYQLKHRHLHDVLHLLPPLQTMEGTLFDLITFGVILLTIAIGTGFVFVDDFFAQHLLHKTVFALSAWVVLAVLLCGRTLWGWRGMVAVKWTLTGFMLLTLGYFGSKVVLEVILQKA